VGGARLVQLLSEHRDIEYDLRLWCLGEGPPMMAYSPVGQGRQVRHPAVRGIAARYGVPLAQVAIAWVLYHEPVITIPEAGGLQALLMPEEGLEPPTRGL
jgi:diketogulonate reductase-like aldo/keto reductase